ncbi:MAG: sulfotransferase, partial [Bacteroidota bacterium]
MNPVTHHWKAPEDALLPHFIIGGAMKSGTSTLHAMLDRHPDIFIPKEEIGFFDIDNILQHYDFNFYERRSKQWTAQNLEDDPPTYWDWYSAKFEAGKEKVRGEDSTSYLASRFAAQRIAMQDEDIKMIFLLRHPSKRAFSNYHHLVRSGVISRCFEDVIQYQPKTVLERSLYKEQLEQYYKYLPKHRIKVIIFEDLVARPELVLRDVCAFLGVDFEKLDAATFDAYANPGRFPLFPRLYRMKNALNRRFGNTFYLRELPKKAPYLVAQRARLPKLFNRLHGMVNPLKQGRTPKMKPAT